MQIWACQSLPRFWIVAILDFFVTNTVTVVQNPKAPCARTKAELHRKILTTLHWDLELVKGGSAPLTSTNKWLNPAISEALQTSPTGQLSKPYLQPCLDQGLEFEVAGMSTTLHGLGLLVQVDFSAGWEGRLLLVFLDSCKSSINRGDATEKCVSTLVVN